MVWDPLPLAVLREGHGTHAILVALQDLQGGQRAEVPHKNLGVKRPLCRGDYRTGGVHGHGARLEHVRLATVGQRGGSFY